MKYYLLVDREEIDQAHALSASLADVQRQGHISVIDQRLAQHPMVMSASAANSTETSAKYQGCPEDFPTLDGTQQSSQPTAEESQQQKPSIAENPAAESGHQAKTSLAKKLAMSSRLSVRNGPMDLADFPSLSDVRPTKTRKGPPMSEADFPSLSSVSKAKLSKTSTASAWNTTDKGSIDQVRPSSHAGKSEDLLSKNSDDDFPSLTSVAADKNAPLSAIPSSHNSLASISRNFSNGTLSKMTDQVDTSSNPTNLSLGPELSRKSANSKEKKQKKNDSSILRNFLSDSLSRITDQVDTASNATSLSWGPELSRKSDNAKAKEPKKDDNFLHIKASKKSGKSSVREAWSGDSGRQTPSETSESVKQVAASCDISNKPTVLSVPAAPSETTTGENDEQTGDASTADSHGWTHVGSEKKTQAKLSKNNKTKLQTDGERGESKKVTKSKAKPAESSSQSKNGKDKSKKKQKISKAQKEPTAEKTSLKDAAKQSLESGAEKGDSDLPSKQVPSETSETFVGRVDSSHDGSVMSSEKRGVGDSTYRSSVLNIEGSELVVIAGTNPTVDITQSSGTTYVAAAVPVFSADDFPSLTVPQLAPLSSLPSLPPGFSGLPVSSSKPPPPGFSDPVVSCCAPPGLNSILSSAIVSDADNRASEVDSEISMSMYIPPQDMQQRSANLVGFIRNAVKDGSFAEFRELSGKFRAGSISAGEYHSGCCDIMDPIAFLSIFPELIALLPDLPKQNQLLKVHRNFLSKNQHAEKTRSWRTTTEDGLVSCVVCGQVLRDSDLHNHASEHGTFNVEYPSLPTTSLCPVR